MEHHSYQEGLSDFETEVFLICGIQEKFFGKPRRIGQTSVTTRGNDMIEIYSLQEKGLLTKGPEYKLTKTGKKLYHFLLNHKGEKNE